MVGPEKQAEKVQKLLAYLELGMPVSQACARVRLPRRTVQDWLAKGRAQIEDDPEADTIYTRLVMDVERARAEFMAQHVEVVNRAAREGEWRASTFMLTKRFPESFGDATKVEHSGMVGNVDIRTKAFGTKDADYIRRRVLGLDSADLADARDLDKARNGKFGV